MVRILVVDDDPHVRAVAADTLTLSGHAVDTAQDGVDALYLLKQNAYDIIVSDLRMPILDGPGLYRALQRYYAALLPRVILVTGHADDKETEARVFLRVREGRVAAGLPLLLRVDRIRYEQVAADLREHYRTTGSRDLVEAEKRLKQLDASFTGRRLVSIDGAEATAYVARRQGQGVANGTINRELAVLTKMLRLAYEHRKLLRLPVIRKLKEAAPRAGFCEPEVFAAIRKRLPEPHGLAVALCYTLAWRRAEVLGVEWRHVDLEGGAVRLDAERSKNDEGRVAFLTPALLAELKAHRTRVEVLQRRLGARDPARVRPAPRVPGRPADR